MKKEFNFNIEAVREENKRLRIKVDDLLLEEFRRKRTND